MRPHYLVCNADESEPGTFKDRYLVEGDPFAVIESMTIAAFATGCEHGYVYLRGEYPYAHHVLGHALDVAREHGFLGRDILGHGLDFEIEIRKGGGAYICGEETAIFESIEGYRGEPRNKPPFPVVSGLFSKPTVVNNVETLVNVLEILTTSGPAFAGVGTEASTGTKLFCVSGNVERAGLYEVPFGATLGSLLELAGGVPDGRELQAVLLGGAAGSFVGPDQLDVPLTFEGAREAGTTLGSGVVLVLDDTVDLPRFLMRVAAFFRNESCGQCVPCRVGTVRQQEALARLVVGQDARWRRHGAGADRRARPVHARRVDLRARSDGVERDRVGGRPVRGLRRGDDMSDLLGVGRMVELEVDGQPVRVFEGQTILDACNKAEVDTPTLCYGETLRPANVCRVCVVELEGSRVLVPSCSRPAEDGMKVLTDSERVRVSRRLVLELLASSVDLSTTPVAPGYLERYDARPERYGPAGGAGSRSRREANGSSRRAGRPDGGRRPHARQGRQRALRPRLLEVHPLLQVRRRLRRAVPEHVRDSCRRARIRRADLDGVRDRAAGVGLCLLWQLHRGLPDGRADVPVGARASRGRRVARGRADGDETICPYCGVGCTLELHVQDNEIVKVTSPDDHDVTRGNLCIKGRFGFQHVQARDA